MITTEQAARYQASVYRSIFLLKMVDNELQYLNALKHGHSGVKKELARLKTVYEKGIGNLQAYLPNQKDVFKKYMEMSDEKISAMCNIMEKVSVLDDAALLEFEDDINKAVKVVYDAEA